MKNASLAACCAALALALSACGGNICQRTESLVKTLNEKSKACKDTSVSVGYTVAQCEEKLKACTGEDNAKLSQWYDCMESLPPCTAGQEDAYDKAFIDCARNKLQGIGSGCLQAFTQ